MRQQGACEAMPKMCGIDAPGEEPMYINPMNVLLLRSFKDGKGIGTRIILADNQMAMVRLPLIQVAELLDIAMNADQA
jgi:hypothetical protein